MVIYVDIDETICFYDGVRNYEFAIPNKVNIDKINNLFDSGNEIVYWTARGSGTGIDWTELTIYQLNEWGCKYNRLSNEYKPVWDLLVDDKTKIIEEV